MCVVARHPIVRGRDHLQTKAGVAQESLCSPRGETHLIGLRASPARPFLLPVYVVVHVSA